MNAARSLKLYADEQFHCFVYRSDHANEHHLENIYRFHLHSRTWRSVGYLSITRDTREESRRVRPTPLCLSSSVCNALRRMDLVFHSHTGHADVERMSRIARELGLNQYATSSMDEKVGLSEPEKV